MTGIVVLVLRVLLAVCLYAFIGWALFTIWRELRLHSELLQARKAPMIRLSLLDASEPMDYAFTVPDFQIGRDPSCEISLSDHAISAHHARFRFHHNQWWIEDMNSTNGTFLNDERLQTSTVIMDGDDLRVGGSIFSIRLGEPPTEAVKKS